MPMPKMVQSKALRLGIWQRDGNLFFADRDALEAAIAKGGKSEEILMREMKFGYQYIADLLDGKGVDLSEAGFVERCILSRERFKITPMEF